MFITANNAQLFTISFGQGGRSLLALGGWAGSWEVWADTLAVLSRTWRAVGYDHRGTGATVAPLESITIEAMVADVFTVMDALALDRPVLAAESAGAMIALLAVLERPERFSGLVIVDGLIHSPRPDAPTPFARGLRANFEATLDGFVELCVPESDSEAIKRWGRQILRRSEPAAAIRLHELTHGVDLRPRVHEIEMPTLVIHGDADALVPLADAEWLAGRLPQARLHVVRGGGHVPTVTRPAEVAAAIDAYFHSS